MQGRTPIRSRHSVIHHRDDSSRERSFPAHPQRAISWIVSPEVLEEDLSRLLEIDRESFGSPWTPDMFADAISGARCTLGCAARSVRGHVLGYGICQVVVDEVHIHRVVVAREYQRRGVGFELLTSMLTHAISKGAQVASLEVR